MKFKEYLDESNISKISDEKLQKLYNQMKDEQLSAAAAMQFKSILREIKKRKIKL